MERGKELFSAHCDDCHPGGEEDVGPSLIGDPHTPPQIRKQVREGSGKMKPFPEKRLATTTWKRCWPIWLRSTR